LAGLSPETGPVRKRGLQLFHSPMAATPIVDQNNPTRWGGFCFTDGGYSCGQSFQQDHSNISGAGIFIDPNFQGGGNGTLTLSIFNTYNPVPSGLIASGTASNVDSNSGWVDVFWTPVVVSTAIQYYLVVESTNLILASYSQSSYLDGNALFSGSDYSGYDLTFRTFADNGAVQVPEPGSLGLFAIGIAGLGFALRRKAANNKRAA
jgi:hypothetical protein